MLYCFKSCRSSTVSLLLCWLTGHNCQKPISLDHALSWSWKLFELELCAYCWSLHVQKFHWKTVTLSRELLLAKPTLVLVVFTWVVCIILLRFYRPWFIITWDLSLLNQYQSFHRQCFFCHKEEVENANPFLWERTFKIFSKESRFISW